MKNKSLKFNLLKRMIDKRILVIENHIKMDYWFGTVKDVVDENTLTVYKNENETKKVDIFDIRNPTKEFMDKYL